MRKDYKERRYLVKQASNATLDVSDKRDEKIMSKSELFKKMAKRGVKKMKFRATIDFDIADDYMKDVYKDSMECLSDEFENFFKHVVITNFDKFFDEKIATEFGIENECKCYYRGTDVKEL